MTRSITFSFILGFSIFAVLTSQSDAAGYPSCELVSPVLKANLYLPDSTNGYYRGTRFDWSGLISRVVWGNHTFFCDFKQEHDPLNHDDICGTADEFGIELAPSFKQAGPGQPFMKIGIGVLERPDGSDYAFWKRYKVLEAGNWKTVRSPNKISFHQVLKGPGHWAYDYTKTVELSDAAPELKIRRRLKNIGTEPIETDQYDHNFLRIDDVPAGTNYSLEFPFAPRFGTNSQTQNCLELRGNRMNFINNLAPDKAIWVRLEGFNQLKDNSIKVVNHATHTSMTITTDQPLSKLVFYSSGGVLCPEAFIKVSLEPGKTQEWTTIYRFESDTN